MAVLSFAENEARNLLNSIGLDEITHLDIKLFAAGLDAIVVEEDLKKCQGRIIFGGRKSIIKVNSTIDSLERKRFVIAHEIGHLIMHKGLSLPGDTFHNFNIIEGIEKFLLYGKQEMEANEFAGELLMPTPLFKIATSGKRFSPDLVKELAERFKTSLTSVIHKYIKFNIGPVCLFQITKGKVQYWRKSSSMNVWVGEITKLPPPSDSVAMEYFKNDYEFIYAREDKAQMISRSTWFELIPGHEDTEFYEYCIPTKKHKSILSVIWES